MSSKGAGLIKTVFNTDNVVMRISEKVLDLVTVNLLFVLSCLPVLTIGIAKISLYQTLFAIKHQRRVPVIRSYATICLGLFLFLVLILLAAYPIAARYQLDWKECLQKAMIVTGLHFPWFFVMGSALLLLCMALASSVLAFLLGLMIFFLFGFSSLAYAQVGLMEKIFAHYQE